MSPALEIGQAITVEGTAEDAKLGALLLLDGGGQLWIDGLDGWPEGVRKKRVRVTGRLIERGDLPVFVSKPPAPGEPIPQGIPVPPGTDLEKASKRRLIAEARWEVLGARR